MKLNKESLGVASSRLRYCDICGPAETQVPLMGGHDLCLPCLRAWWSWARVHVPERGSREQALTTYIQDQRTLRKARGQA